MSQTIVLAGGCFWCLEAIFQRVNGIINVKSGYAGGNTINPTFRTLCINCDCHAEVIKINFDPKTLSLEKILVIFWNAHDPTTLNKQGNDIGKQYRSAIFYSNVNQKMIIQKSIVKVAELIWRNKVLTEILPLKEFFPADESNDNFYGLNPNHPYSEQIINPKLVLLKAFLEESKDTTFLDKTVD
jgi:peptide-methionine (S)-S-oxide reductase